jgi:hypothetical protein
LLTYVCLLVFVIFVCYVAEMCVDTCGVERCGVLDGYEQGQRHGEADVENACVVYRWEKVWCVEWNANRGRDMEARCVNACVVYRYGGVVCGGVRQGGQEHGEAEMCVDACEL